MTAHRQFRACFCPSRGSSPAAASCRPREADLVAGLLGGLGVCGRALRLRYGDGGGVIDPKTGLRIQGADGTDGNKELEAAISKRKVK